MNSRGEGWHVRRHGVPCEDFRFQKRPQQHVATAGPGAGGGLDYAGIELDNNVLCCCWCCCTEIEDEIGGESDQRISARGLGMEGGKVDDGRFSFSTFSPAARVQLWENFDKTPI